MSLLFIDFFMSGSSERSRLCLRLFIGKSCSPRVLSSDYFHFTRTTKHQPTRNLHSSTSLFAVTSTASHCISFCQKIKYHKVREYSRGKWPNYFVVFDHFHGKCQLYYQAPDLPEVFHLLWVSKQLYRCGIPKKPSRK